MPQQILKKETYSPSTLIILRFRGNSLWYPIFASAASAFGSVVEPLRPILPVIELLLLFIILTDSSQRRPISEDEVYLLSNQQRRCANAFAWIVQRREARWTSDATDGMQCKRERQGRSTVYPRANSEHQVACPKRLREPSCGELRRLDPGFLS
jgi:hypothetical protein